MCDFSTGIAISTGLSLQYRVHTEQTTEHGLSRNAISAGRSAQGTDAVTLRVRPGAARAAMNNFRARVVLLGASNVTKGVSVIIETARLMLGSPLDVYCAIGHGRSYGQRSSVLVRSLPSILESPLWQVIDENTSGMPTYAVIADVGNDVMYGANPQQIADWVDRCVQRLQAVNARIVMTSLPMQRIERLSQWQYFLARSLLFPGNRLTLDEAKHRASETVQCLEALAAQRDVPLVQLRGSWYGVDPIHMRYGIKPLAWRQVLQYWIGHQSGEAAQATGSLRRWLRLRALSPEQWWLLGMRRGRRQPAATLSDGSQVSLY